MNVTLAAAVSCIFLCLASASPSPSGRDEEVGGFFLHGIGLEAIFGRLGGFSPREFRRKRRPKNIQQLLKGPLFPLPEYWYQYQEALAYAESHEESHGGHDNDHGGYGNGGYGANGDHGNGGYGNGGHGANGDHGEGSHNGDSHNSHEKTHFAVIPDPYRPGGRRFYTGTRSFTRIP
ncbi:uncharacterized protein LOC135216137 [Macrobrachium nipponense]|uniref:uncharacterized protein LOC135216137 n=1 Tax=Macrobrachium nipponense TaxID=159736 RepID=UPI0030C7F624